MYDYAKLDKYLIFRELFSDVKHVSDNQGIITSAPVINNGAKFDGTDDKITYPTVRQVKSISFWITLATTTEDIMELSSSHSIEAVSGTLTATGVSSPTFYVNSTATATIGTTRSHVVITTATAFNADSLDIGADDTFGEFTIEDVQMYNVALTAEEVKDLYERDTYAELERPLINLPLRSWYYKASGTELYTDGDMEAAGVASWSSIACTLTKETASPQSGVRSLRLTKASGSTGSAYQTITTAGKRYKIRGWGRGDGAGNVLPRISDGAVSLWTGTNSTTWQYFDIEFIAPGSTPLLQAATGGAGEWAEFDNVSIQLMEAQTENKGTLGGTFQLGNGTTATTFPTFTSPHEASFDGGDYFVTNKIYTAYNEPFTIAVPIQLGAIGASQDVLSNYDGTSGLIFRVNSSGTLAIFLFKTNSDYIGRLSTKTISAGKHHVITASYDGTGAIGGLRLYLDGVRIDTSNAGTGTYGAFTNTTNLYLGRSPSGSSPLLAGGKIFNFYMSDKYCTPIQARKLSHDMLHKLNT